MQSKAKTPKAYLSSLPKDRRDALEAVRKVIVKNLGKGYAEGMQYGMIGYFVPHSVYPPGYHCDPKQPVPFAAIASQKNYMSVYLNAMYGGGFDESWIRARFEAAGKKLDMGKCCIRFKKLEDLPLDVIGEAIRSVPMKQYIEQYERAIGRSASLVVSKKKTKKKIGSKKATKKNAAKKVTSKRTPKKKTVTKKATARKKVSTKKITKKRTAKRS